MQRKALAGFLSLLVVLSYVGCFTAGIISPTSPEPLAQGLERVVESESVAIFGSLMTAVVLVAPYLLWRSRALGMALSLPTFVLLGASIVSVSDPTSTSVLVLLLLPSIIGLVGSACFLLVLRAEREAWWRTAAADQIILDEPVAHRLKALSDHWLRRDRWYARGGWFYLWLGVTVIGLAVSLTAVQNAKERRAMSFQTTGIAELVADSESTEEPRIRVVVPDLPEIECPFFTDQEIPAGTEVLVLIEPSAGDCEVAAYPSEPIGSLLLASAGISFMVGETLRKMLHARTFRALGCVDAAVPIMAVQANGQVLKQRLSAFDSRIVVEADSFMAVPASVVTQRFEGLLGQDIGEAEPMHCLPVSEYGFDGNQPKPRWMQSSLSDHLVLKVLSVRGVDAETDEPETGRSRERTATGGPYLVLTQTITADRMLVGDPVSGTILTVRLLGGYVGESVRGYDAVDALVDFSVLSD